MTANHASCDPRDAAPGHLIHIGYPKSASNALRRWFAAHPELEFVDGGLAGFRDVYAIARDSAAPRPGVRYRVTSSEGLAIPHRDFGRPGADYAQVVESDAEHDQPAACAILHSLFPGAYVLIVTRGFAGAVRSGFSQFVRTGGDPAAFGLAQAGGGRAIDAERHPRNYDRLVGLYRAAFGDRVIVLPWEWFRDDPEAFVAAIERRLGLAHCPAPPDLVNPSLSEAELAWYPRLTRLIRRLPVGARLRRRLFGAMARNRLRPLALMLQRLRPAPPLALLFDDRIVEPFSGRAESLRAEPGYDLYAADYLLEAADGR